MIYINHRINTLAQLAVVPQQNGAEVDIRYHENELILHHDPFEHHTSAPEKFEDFLKQWSHDGVLILNIKTEGVEQKCIDLMNQYGVKNWFFLDLSMPYFVQYSEHAKNGILAGFLPDNLAVRYSEFEPIEYALSFKNSAKWVWVDCFTYLPLDKTSYAKLKEAGFKICIVSPELQKHDVSYIHQFKEQLKPFEIDAVCTKRPDLWEKKV